MYSLVLFLALTSASAVQKLNSINDLKQVNFGPSVPKHSLVLLHWFANTIEIDNNDVIQLTFEPESGDYGAHHYGNFERMLDPLPRGYRYYTLGNLNTRNIQGSNLELPPYVTQNRRNLMELRNEERNRDRIIFRVRGQNTQQAWQTIDQVYITQHYESVQQRGTAYDLAHTYRITTNLLREIREFSVEGHTETMPSHFFQGTYQSDMKLEVGTGVNGNTRIHWSNIPQQLLNQGVMVVLFKNDKREESSRIVDGHGSYDTSVPLNPGLQVRLHKAKTVCCFWTTVGGEICRGTEFHNSRAQKPVHIRPYDASLQLFVKDGKACARLYVSKTFREWRSDFRKSWVGFYSSATKNTNEYDWWQWQWATKFKRCPDLEDPLDHVYEYHSSMTIARGLQARFILDGEDIVHTPIWE
ncbi:uncharacterized protein ACN63O_012274 [Diretmus argenteus]